MRIVVIGDGKIGFTVTQALVREGHDLVVIDNQAAALKQTEDSLDVQVIEGNGASVSVQKQADVAAADLMIIVPEQETFKVQELHLPVYHALCLMLEETYFG